jgi:hypothetical protein
VAAEVEINVKLTSCMHGKIWGSPFLRKLIYLTILLRSNELKYMKSCSMTRSYIDEVKPENTVETVIIKVFWNAILRQTSELKNKDSVNIIFD